MRDWNPRTFRHGPWGVPGLHKGIDIFAPRGRDVVSAVPGIVVYRGEPGIGGHVVAVRGPRWRILYYAHLEPPKTDAGGAAPLPRFVGRGTRIGAVGTSGKAAGKAPHLHHAVVPLVSLPWRYSHATQG
ncbi:M23 family metallopeptidase [Paracidovorax anthurii]|uniref:M23 family metallopeptidase n=1 Tax=Paracidovorax anthurii TaxID=78229 RepID=UPI001B86E7BA|nr:M23 family metallopeptidase [Paracidovorax anthurii]